MVEVEEALVAVAVAVRRLPLLLLLVRRFLTGVNVVDKDGLAERFALLLTLVKLPTHVSSHLTTLARVLSEWCVQIIRSVSERFLRVRSRQYE